MDLAHPLALITPTADGDVLAALARAESSFTGRGVHQLVGRYSQEGVRKVLDRLVGQGVVTVRTIGRSNVYEFNRRHLAAPYIRALADLRAEFLRGLSEQLGAWAVAPVYAALFGSAARGDMRPDSDIDLLIVRGRDIDVDRPLWREQLDSLARDATACTGNDVRVLEMSDQEVQRALAKANGVLRSIRDEGLPVFGPDRYLRRRPEKRGA